MDEGSSPSQGITGAQPARGSPPSLYPHHAKKDQTRRAWVTATSPHERDRGADRYLPPSAVPQSDGEGGGAVVIFFGWEGG